MSRAPYAYHEIVWQPAALDLQSLLYLSGGPCHIQSHMCKSITFHNIVWQPAALDLQSLLYPSGSLQRWSLFCSVLVRLVDWSLLTAA